MLVWFGLSGLVGLPDLIVCLVSWVFGSSGLLVWLAYWLAALASWNLKRNWISCGIEIVPGELPNDNLKEELDIQASRECCGNCLMMNLRRNWISEGSRVHWALLNDEIK